jgi:hypothetical protein
MRTTYLLFVLLAACSGSPKHPTDGGSTDGASPADASMLGIPTYPSTPSQTIAAPVMATGNFGLNIAVSADGSTLVTCPIDSGSGMGTLLVYARSGTSFGATPVQTLSTPPNTIAFCSEMLSLSHDGSMLVLGAADATGAHAEVLVYTRGGASFATTPTQTLTLPVGMTANMNVISADGSTLAASVSASSSSPGSIFVYTRSGASFGAMPTQTLAPPSDATEFFGGVGALSQDGAILLVSDVEGNGPGGKVYVYTKSGSTFATPPSQTLSAPSGVSSFGSDIALRPDGLELVESGDQPPHVTIYASSSTGFSAVQMLTLPAGAPANFDPAVALAADGTLFVGGSATSSLYVYPAK